MSLHKYLYAANDPINNIDPSGEQVDLSGFHVVINMSNILSAVEIPSYAGITSRFVPTASLTFYASENIIEYKEKNKALILVYYVSYEARDEVKNGLCYDKKRKRWYRPTPIEIGYKYHNVTPEFIKKDKSYGEGWTYIDTGHRRGKDIHGGGSCLGDEGAFGSRQGWCVTCGCIRMQNEDIRALSRRIRDFQKTGSKVPFEVKK